MRTRFLNADFFTFSSFPDETLSFLNLPIPALPPPRLPNVEENLFCFDIGPNISLEIQRLPIDSALSKFISELLPQKINIDYGYFQDHQSQNADGCTDEQRRFTCRRHEIRFSEEEAEGLCEDMEECTQRAHGSDCLEAMPLPKDNETSLDDEHMHRFEIIQFEAPELDELSENVSLPEVGMKILSEVSECENDPDFIRPGDKMQCSDEVQESIYLVDDVTLEYDLDKKDCVLEVDDSIHEQKNSRHTSFPLLEVDEISLRNFSNLSVEDELLSFFENINPKNNLLMNDMELLGSVQHDVLEFLSNNCLLKQHLESELASVDTVLGIDIISIVDRKDSDYCSSPMSPHVFQEFQFLEVDSSHIYEVFFKMQKPDEPKICNLMFKEDKNFKNFNELIVSCELALVDDIFKSMPIPILSDDNKIKSFHVVVEEILAEIKPQPLSASDGIYLDWHLLKEDKYNSKVFSLYHNVLGELDPLNIHVDWEPFDKGLIDIVSSEDAFNGPKVAEYKESLDMFANETSSGQLMIGASSKLLDDKHLKSGNGEHLAKANVEEVSLLFKSMTQFNDLEFFLNPGKAASGEKYEPAIKTPSTEATFPKEGRSHSILAMDKNMDEHKLKEVFNFLPTEDKHNVRTSEAADKETCCMPVPVPNVPSEVKSEQTQGSMMSFPEIMIVVNIQNLEKEMIVSRRSTYQKILAMEKEGLQVVERDLDLPVDIVIVSAICLVWYDCRNIRKKATGVDEASSCLPLCIEIIATNVLTLLSFSFSCCILVFEGDANFLSTVMEYSDGLYAAAASLGIDLQLFCSYSSELTDEIILNNISYATKLSRGIYPKMPESETLAESFLTKFPSINPLTAHAILSLRGTLIEFLEWPNERRILAVQQCRVPEESISLFSALCSYGEREDSKSIMTDCSSSVSSGPDSNKGHFNVASETKPMKYISSPQKIDTCVNDIWQSEPLNQFPDDLQGPGLLKQDDFWASGDTEILEELQCRAPPLKDLFGQKQRLDIPQIMGSFTVSKPCDFQNLKRPLVLDEIKRPRLYLNHQNEISETKINSKSENLHEDFLGEVIDLTGSLGKDVPSTTNSMYYSTWLPETEEDSTKKSKTARRMSFGRNSRPTFPTAAAINSGSDLWSSVTDFSQSLQQNNGYSDSDMPLKHPKKLLENVLRQTCGGNANKSPFKEEMSHYGATPLSKAIQSSHSQPCSPWTVEFLNRIREKSRLRQQSLPCDASTPDFGYSGNTSKVAKRRSPSILEFFKYKGGSKPGKLHEQKKQKQSKQLSSSSKSKSTSGSFLPTWTPIDKRSIQTLSFAMNDSGSQTRLVWNDGSAHRLSKKLRNQ